MRAGNSLVTRLVLVITLSSAAILGVTLGYQYSRSRAYLRRELESNARHLALSLVHRVETQLVSAAKVTEGVARSLETTRLGEAELLGLLRSTIDSNAAIHGIGVAFEPKAFDPGARLYAPFYQRDAGGVALRKLEQAYRHVPYLHWDWYQIPRELGRTEWSEPYFDEGAGDILMCTCAVPFHRDGPEGRRLAGMAAANISVDELTQLISSVRILETGYAALLSRNGMILAHPVKELVINETFFTIAEARGDPALRELGRSMVRGGTGFVPYRSLLGAQSWMYFAPIRSTGWTLAVVFPEDELLANPRRLTLTLAGMGGVGLLLLVLAVAFIARALTRPLLRLAAATRSVAAGDFDAPLPGVRVKDEVGQLTEDFRSMQASLKEYIRNLTETTAAKERIQGELKVATQIQASLLPRIFPPFPEHTEFDIYASMVPAKEVGGDFYDFFLLGDTRVCFLIADVSDKGVPAALYMMVVKTLLKTEGQRLGEPGRILTAVNRVLAADNENCMFATVFCAILDYRSGEVGFANAGHNPPVLLGEGGARFLRMPPALPLGAAEETRYETCRLQLGPGDALVLYTDGVTEAKDADERLYGEERLLRTVATGPCERVRDVVARVSADVSRHAAGASQSDDITLLAIRITAPLPGGAQVRPS